MPRSSVVLPALSRADRYRRVMESLMTRLETRVLTAVPFTQSQEILFSHVAPRLNAGDPLRFITLKPRQMFCLDPRTRILTGDLTWMELEDVKPGQALVTIDEPDPQGRGSARKMRLGAAVRLEEVWGPACELIMSNGERLIATEEHRFLTDRAGRTCWRPVSSLGVGHPIRAITTPWREGNREDGWFGGLIDGDGHVRQRWCGASVTIVQVAGSILDRALDYLKDRGYTFYANWDQRHPGLTSKLGVQPVCHVTLTRMMELFRLGGQTRATKMNEMLWWDGKKLPMGNGESQDSWPTIVAKVPLGPRRMIDLETTTGTFIAEGFVSHNSTSFWSKLMFTHTVGNPGVHSLVIAQDVPTAHEILDMAKRFNQYLPLPALVPSRATELTYPFPGGTSRFRIQSAKMTGRGRGANWTCVLASEVPYWPNPEIAVGVRNAVPDLPDTLWVEESTANGKSGLGKEFYEHWVMATTGDSDLVPIFVSWVTMVKYRLATSLPPDDWDAYERRIAETFGGPNGLEYPAPKVHDPRNMRVIGSQFAWRRMAIKVKCKNSADIFDQEYPITPEVAFIASGIPAFDQHALLAQHENVMPPKLRGLMRNGRFTEHPKGHIRLWAEPRPDHQYVIGADTAEGLDAAEGNAQDFRDYAAAEILDMRTLEQVGSIHGYIAPWDFSDMLNQVGRWFNDALLAVEINNHGHTVQDRLIREFYYPNLHRWRGKPDRAVSAQINKRLYGWECLTEGSLVLTSDLRWVPAESLQVGDDLLGCEEQRSAPGHALGVRIQHIREKRMFIAPILEVTLENGRQTRVSSTHPFWILRGNVSRWCYADQLRIGDQLKCLPIWNDIKSWESGRLSAFLDGEGHLARGRKGGFHMLVSQSEGPLADEIAALWSCLGFDTTFKWARHSGCPAHWKPIMVVGTIQVVETLRALGSLRPSRLLRVFAEQMVERLTIRAFPNIPVVSVQYVGDGPVIGIETSPDHTLIADGIVGHNTNSYSRPLMIDAGRRVINDTERTPLVLHEEKLLEELSNFSLMDNNKYEAEYGHDDRVIALLIALRSREENYVEARVSSTEASEPDLQDVRVIDHQSVRAYSADGYPQVVASESRQRLFSKVAKAVTSYLQL